MTPTQLPDESDRDYRAFLGWLLSKPRRLPESEDLARQFEWSRRAAQFDAAFSGPANFDAVPNQNENTKRNLERLVALEVKKYLERSEGAIGVPVLTPQELIRLYGIMMGRTAKELDVAPDGGYYEKQEEPDLSGLTNEELEVLEKIHEKRS
jgi:hypothetical protein